MLSAIGSIVNRMNSFTDTTDFMTGAAGAGAGRGGASDDFDEEHAIALAHTRAAATTRRSG
jgi:hypothetical protein